MTWCEVSVAVPVEQAELAAEALRLVAPGGVSIEDPVVPLGPEEGVRLERRRPSVVKAYLPVDDRLGERLGELDAAFGALQLRPVIRTRQVQEEDWADAWKQHFHVERFGERIVIRPSWRAYDPHQGDVVIVLDPGMAFGTGQHPTTRMCLELLEQHVTAGARMVDAGTGSGILAVAAIKLGAASCLAVDIEPQAVQVTRENATRNGVAAAVDVELGSLGEGWTRPVPPPSGLDLATANITAAAVASLAPALAAVLRAGGVLIASGIIGERLPEVLTALTAAGFDIEEVRESGDWRALLARKHRG